MTAEHRVPIAGVLELVTPYNFDTPANDAAQTEVRFESKSRLVSAHIGRFTNDTALAVYTELDALLEVLGVLRDDLRDKLIRDGGL